MSRLVFTPNEHTTFISGNDHAIGPFLDITDKRFANSGKDRLGEGFIMEWSEMFGFSNNLIGATVGDLEDVVKLQAKVEIFIHLLIAGLE